MTARAWHSGVVLTAFAFSLCYAGSEATGRMGSGEWKAGTAGANITPAEGLWMGGYAARTRPAEGKEMDLRLKVLALEDRLGHRGVIVTSDLLGFPQSIYKRVSPVLKQKVRPGTGCSYFIGVTHPLRPGIAGIGHGCVRAGCGGALADREVFV